MEGGGERARGEARYVCYFTLCGVVWNFELGLFLMKVGWLVWVWVSVLGFGFWW